jgi:hypothetical protein
VGASNAAADAETDQLPEDEGPVVVPLEGASERAQVTIVVATLVDDVGEHGGNSCLDGRVGGN